MFGMIKTVNEIKSIIKRGKGVLNISEILGLPRKFFSETFSKRI